MAWTWVAPGRAPLSDWQGDGAGSHLRSEGGSYCWKVHTYYLCRCVQRAFEPKPLLPRVMPEPLAARDIRLAGFGSRRDCDSAPHSSLHPLGWRNGASMETLSCVRVDHRVKLKIVKAYAIPSQKYRKRRLPDCPDRETQSSAFAFPALSRASGLHELSGRSSICAIPSNL